MTKLYFLSCCLGVDLTHARFEVVSKTYFQKAT